AAEHALDLLDGEDMDTDVAGLRLFVQQGGCAGLSYGMRFDTEPEDDDKIYEHHDLRVFVDPASMNYIGGSVLDFEGGLQCAGFEVGTPIVVSGCGFVECLRTCVRPFAVVRKSLSDFVYRSELVALPSRHGAASSSRTTSARENDGRSVVGSFALL